MCIHLVIKHKKQQQHGAQVQANRFSTQITDGTSFFSVFWFA